MKSSGHWVLFDRRDGREGLIIGNLPFVNNPSNLIKNNVKAVLSVIRIKSLDHRVTLPESTNIKHKLIEIDDHEQTDILSYFEPCISFIDRNLSRGNVVVHCQMGISRSATVIIAYLMDRFKWSYKHTRNYLRDIRPVIYPNDGFVNQLKLWEDKLRIKERKRRRLRKQ